MVPPCLPMLNARGGRVTSLAPTTRSKAMDGGWVFARSEDVDEGNECGFNLDGFEDPSLCLEV